MRFKHVLSVAATICAMVFAPASCNAEIVTTSVVDDLDGSDLIWDVNETGELRLSFRGRAAAILKLARPPLSELQLALSDRQRFLPAHLLLAQLIYGPACGLVEDSRTTWFQGVELRISMPTDGNGSPNATLVEKDARAIGAWSFTDKSITELALLCAARTRTLALRAPKSVTLSRRSTAVVAAIRNSDVTWSHSGFGNPSPILAEGTLKAANSRPSLEALIEALNDPSRFVAAHLLLCREFELNDVCSRSTEDGFHGLYNGLRVDVRGWRETAADGRFIWRWEVEIPNPDRQRRLLAKRWEFANAIVSATGP